MTYDKEITALLVIDPYNDFIAEFCSYNPKRFIGNANIPASSAESASAELRRVGKQGLGLRGAMIDWFNGPEPIWHTMWEPMWTAAEENDVALSFHIGVGHGTTTCGPSGCTSAWGLPMRGGCGGASGSTANCSMTS